MKSTDSISAPSSASAPCNRASESCAGCGGPFGAWVWLLDDGALWCSACVCRPEHLSHMIAAPLLDRVVAGGSREAVTALVSQSLAAHTQHTQPPSALVSALSPDQQTGADHD